MNWINVAQDKDQWKVFVNTVVDYGLRRGGGAEFEPR
jgi:hypothetical protein